jgi:hypothetical protein
MCGWLARRNREMLNRVIAFEHDRRIAWEPTPGDEVAVQGIRKQVEDGPGWVPAMHQTLERLAALVGRRR